MWADLSDDDLLKAARRRTKRRWPLPLDLQVELMSRGFTLEPFN